VLLMRCVVACPSLCNGRIDDMFSADYGDPFATPIIPVAPTAKPRLDSLHACHRTGAHTPAVSLASLCYSLLWWTPRVTLCCRSVSKPASRAAASVVDNAAELFTRFGVEVEAMANRMQDHVCISWLVCVRDSVVVDPAGSERLCC
jgi:hypothetical protein